MSSPQPLAPDADLAEDMAYAKRRRAMLDRMAEVGMALIEELGERNIDAPYHPEPRHDPARAFAALSRAVRLTLVLQGRVQAEIIALRKGVPAPVAANPPRKTCDVHQVVDKASGDEESGDAATEADARDRLYESLVDREDDEALLALPFDACVDAIRTDLSRHAEALPAAATPVGGWDDLSPPPYARLGGVGGAPSKPGVEVLRGRLQIVETAAPQRPA